jgi:hypothetical protein
LKGISGELMAIKDINNLLRGKMNKSFVAFAIVILALTIILVAQNTCESSQNSIRLKNDL